MAYSNTSSAYDFSAFEERPVRASAVEKEAPVRNAQPKKKANVIQLNEQQLRRSHRHNAHMAKALMSLCAVLVVVGAIGAVVMNQVQLTELTDQINTANKSLMEQKSISVQLEMQAASQMDTDAVEVYARERLGMEKVAPAQTTYINLAQDDAGVVLQNNEQPGLLREFWNSFRALFS
ncbi:MAG: hypothetical protein IJF56_09920 [Clostridia bacterium]|nr:hypothetical protein [Clostridia bacterium]